MHTNNQNDWKQSGSKDFWKIVRGLAGKEKDIKKLGPIENDEEVLVYTDEEKAEAFNNYFTDIDMNLASQFPLPGQSDYSYITRVCPPLSDVSNIHKALTKQLDKMKPYKAQGSDKITQ